MMAAIGMIVHRCSFVFFAFLHVWNENGNYTETNKKNSRRKLLLDPHSCPLQLVDPTGWWMDCRIWSLIVRNSYLLTPAPQHLPQAKKEELVPPFPHPRSWGCDWEVWIQSLAGQGHCAMQVRELYFWSPSLARVLPQESPRVFTWSGALVKSLQKSDVSTAHGSDCCLFLLWFPLSHTFPWVGWYWNGQWEFGGSS